MHWENTLEHPVEKSSLRSSVYLHRAFGSHGGGPSPVPRTGGTQGARRLTPPREESCPSLASQPRRAGVRSRQRRKTLTHIKRSTVFTHSAKNQCRKLPSLSSPPTWARPGAPGPALAAGVLGSARSQHGAASFHSVSSEPPPSGGLLGSQAARRQGPGIREDVAASSGPRCTPGSTCR